MAMLSDYLQVEFKEEETIVLTDHETGDTFSLLAEEAMELAWRLVKHFLRDVG
jgi:hypothetical protein